MGAGGQAHSVPSTDPARGGPHAGEALVSEWDTGYAGETRDPVPNEAYTVAGQVGATAQVDDPPDAAAAERVRVAWAPLQPPY